MRLVQIVFSCFITLTQMTLYSKSAVFQDPTVCLLQKLTSYIILSVYRIQYDTFIVNTCCYGNHKLIMQSITHLAVPTDKM